MLRLFQAIIRHHTWQLLQFVLVCELHVVFVRAQPGRENAVSLDVVVGALHQLSSDFLCHPEWCEDRT